MLQLDRLRCQSVFLDYSLRFVVPSPREYVPGVSQVGQTNLEREIFVRRHKTYTLKVIGHVASTLLLGVCRERRTAGALAFRILDTEGGA